VVCPKGYAKAARDGVALRCQVADALDGETARPLPALGGLEPINGTLRRLIGSSVVVGLASVSRRHERPSRMAVSRRSGTSRPPPRAARLQARVGSGSASPPPVEPTNLASPLSPVPVWPGGPCVCWPTRRCCQLGTPPGGAIGPNFGGTLGRRRTTAVVAGHSGSLHWRRRGLGVAESPGGARAWEPVRASPRQARIAPTSSAAQARQPTPTSPTVKTTNWGEPISLPRPWCRPRRIVARLPRFHESPSCRPPQGLQDGTAARHG
jgi:hypothetical protein